MRIPAAMHPSSTMTQQILCHQPWVALQPSGILLFMMDSYSTADPIPNLPCEGPQTQVSHQGAAIYCLAYHALITLPTRPAMHATKASVIVTEQVGLYRSLLPFHSCSSFYPAPCSNWFVLEICPCSLLPLQYLLCLQNMHLYRCLWTPGAHSSPLSPHIP